MKRTVLFCFALAFAWAAQADNHEVPTPYGQYFALTVSDPEAVVAAMQKYRASSVGQQATSVVVLAQNLANGRDTATHTVSVFYESAADMAANQARATGSADQAAFSAAMQAAATVEMDNIFSNSMNRINDPSIELGVGTTTMLFALNVTDVDRYMPALTRIMQSDAAGAFPGNLYAGQIIASGETPGTHWVTFQAKDVGTLLSGVEAFLQSDDFAEYAEDADEFRSVTARYVSRNILTLAPPAE